MSVIKTLQYIKNHPWDWNSTKERSSTTPISASVTNKVSVTNINEVETWEELHYEPGVVGVYAAFEPYCDYFIIVHNLLADTEYGIEKFYGKNAHNDVITRCTELGINISTKKETV